MHDPFHDVLALNGRKAVILDGGFGTELERQGKDYGQVSLPFQMKVCTKSLGL